jgi:hypothetical protein
MRAHNGRVDHRVFVVGVCSQPLEEPLPRIVPQPITPLSHAISR